MTESSWRYAEAPDLPVPFDLENNLAEEVAAGRLFRPSVTVNFATNDGRELCWGPMDLILSKLNDYGSELPIVAYEGISLSYSGINGQIQTVEAIPSKLDHYAWIQVEAPLHTELTLVLQVTRESVLSPDGPENSFVMRAMFIPDNPAHILEQLQKGGASVDGTFFIINDCNSHPVFRKPEVKHG